MANKRTRALRKIFQLALLFPPLWIPQHISAEELYRWTDEFGQVHFSSKPMPNSQRVEELPKITKENFDRRIERLKSGALLTCAEHGGFDCQKGRDEDDGSVICTDGYRDAALSFLAKCSETKLSMRAPIVFGADGQERGELMSQKPGALGDSDEIRFLLRNETAVAAEEVRVTFVVPGKERFEAIGPETVEPFGAAEYSLHLKTVALMYPLAQLKRYKVRVECKNCSAPLQLNR